MIMRLNQEHAVLLLRTQLCVILAFMTLFSRLSFSHQ